MYFMLRRFYIITSLIYIQICYYWYYISKEQKYIKLEYEDKTNHLHSYLIVYLQEKKRLIKKNRGLHNTYEKLEKRYSTDFVISERYIATSPRSNCPGVRRVYFLTRNIILQRVVQVQRDILEIGKISTLIKFYISHRELERYKVHKARDNEL